jgi:SepF-like predicted cell division protein (DUF552 family)
MLKCSECGFENNEPTSCAKCGAAIQKYIKALPLTNDEDVFTIKKELDAGNILIINLIPFVTSEFRKGQSFSKVVQTTNELVEYTDKIGGDVARLGSERLILAPSSIKIWDLKSRSSSDENI